MVDARKILKLTLLSNYDVCHEKCRLDLSRVVYHSGGLRLFKCLMSSICRFDCRYCYNPWRGRERLSPEEFARVFFALHRRGIADSVFISSGIYSDPENVMEDILRAGELIRREFGGYMHLKVMPGASRDQVKRAVELANRVSINAEVAVRGLFDEVCSVKSRYDVERRARWISREVSKAGKSCTTQIIVGLGESDRDVLDFMERWYGIGVKRVYFSPFRAIRGTPYENRRSESRERVVNLYRADWLVRKYGVDVRRLKEVVDDRFECDPKVLLATKFGVKKATDIPGIGFKAAKALEKAGSFAKLKRMGFSLKRAAPFLPGQKKLEDYFGSNE